MNRDTGVYLIEQISTGRRYETKLERKCLWPGKASRLAGLWSTLIAHSFGVDKSVISEIKTGKSYRWVA